MTNDYNSKFTSLNFSNLLLTNICFGLIIQAFFCIALTSGPQNFENIAITFLGSILFFIFGTSIANITKLNNKKIIFLSNTTGFTASLSIILLQDFQLSMLYSITLFNETQRNLILFLTYLALFALYGAFLNLWLKRNQNYYRRGTFLTFFFGIIIGIIIGQIITLKPEFYLFLLIIFPVAIFFSLFYCKKLYAKIIQGLSVCLTLAFLSFALFSFKEFQNSNFDKKASKKTSLAIRGLLQNENFGFRGLWTINKKNKTNNKIFPEVTATLNRRPQESYNLYQTQMLPLAALLLNGKEYQKILYYSAPEKLADLYYLFAVKEIYIIKPDTIFKNVSYGTKIPPKCKQFFIENNIFKLKDHNFDTVVYTLPNNTLDLYSISTLDLLQRCNDDKFLKKDGILLFKLNSTKKNFVKLVTKIEQYVQALSLKNFLRYATFNINENYFGIALIKHNSSKLPKNTAELDERLSALVDKSRPIPLAGTYALLFKDSFSLQNFDQHKIFAMKTHQKKSLFVPSKSCRLIFGKKLTSFVNKYNFLKNKYLFLIGFAAIVSLYFVFKTLSKRKFHNLRIVRCFDFGLFQGIVLFMAISTTLIFTNTIFYEFKQLLMFFTFGALFSLIGFKPPVKTYSILTISALFLIFSPFWLPQYTLFINGICLIFVGLSMRKLLLDYVRHKNNIRNAMSYFTGLLVGAITVFLVLFNVENYFYLFLLMFIAYNNEFLLCFQAEQRR